MPQHTWKGTWRGKSPDGLSHKRAREVVRPTGGIVRGKFPSRKNGRMIHYEGLLELDAIYLFETSPRITRYTEQPETVRYPDGGRLRRYTPDFELTLDSGTTILIEVKPRRNAEEADTLHKLNCVADYFSRHHRQFCVLTDDQIRMEPRQANMRWIYHQSPRVYGSRLKARIALKRLAVDFPMPISVASSLLATYDLDPYSLLLSGLLTCDLCNPVSLDTQLYTNLENGCHDWFFISDRYGF